MSTVIDLAGARRRRIVAERAREIENRIRCGLRVNSLGAHEEMARCGMSLDELVRYYVKTESRATRRRARP